MALSKKHPELVSRTVSVAIRMIVFSDRSDIVVDVDGQETYRLSSPDPLHLPQALQLVAIDQKMNNTCDVGSLFDAGGVAAFVIKRMEGK